ncbi:serine/threonine-protein kinase meng-po isoform X2 [Adelges cooleyi]|uniref:serine/threonine-protein kinase meng-po isoform X2 n=1 Tax=Adelges cooleyi TaxID=133065 RepID=UPI00217F44D5|nr:serine/threonine-protein kinase meng-po isoform X2 [Adelges cooleyi]XP_050429568.1 serine/threonine-protein kinase meng-po isoform X2 [Adelges cooleyi]XP_050429571.1 serine/threonine-protein kinase meng-po isoform X2 [Adelges cooleyi]
MIDLIETFDIVQIVGEGWFGKILLVEHRGTDNEMVLKALPKNYIAVKDFYREFHYSYHLSAHRNIVSTFDVAFQTASFYVFAQEYAPLGDLTSNISDNGIGELHSKSVAKQLVSAIQYIHSCDLVHRDIKLDNILVFKSDFSRIKLCDFGETRKNGSWVTRRNEWIPYMPPEILAIDTEHKYKVETSHDVWQFAVVLFVCLTGCLPWQKASSEDPRFVGYVYWLTSNGIMSPFRRPKLFKLLTSNAQRMFRKFLQPNIKTRPSFLDEVHNFIDERWLSKYMLDKNKFSDDVDELSPSLYSYQTDQEENKHFLLAFANCGIETVIVDRAAKKERIKQWIQASVIEEEEEDTSENTSRLSLSHRSSSNIEENELYALTKRETN